MLISAPIRATSVKRFRLPAGPLSGMRMVVRTWPADVGTPWLCETVQEIDAGVPALRVSPGCVVNAGIRLLAHHGTPRAACAQVSRLGQEAGMQVLYQRCAAVDVGKDVIAVAVRLPGDGPDGRRTIKRTFKTFYGVLAEAARSMGSLGSPMWRWRPRGSTACRSTTRWPGTGTLRRCWCATPGMSGTCRAARRILRRRVAGAPAGVRPAGRQLHPPGGDQGGPGCDPLPHESGAAAGQRDRPARQRAPGRRDQDRPRWPARSRPSPAGR